MRLLLSLLLLAPALAQIVPTPTQVTATAGTLVCIITRTGATVTAGGKPYDVWTPPLVNGADASISFVWNGAKINPSLSMKNNVIGWSVTIQPLGGAAVTQAGKFISGPVAMGTLVNGRCLNLGTTFHPSFTQPVNNGQRDFVGAVLVADRVIVSNCELAIQ